MRELPDRVDVVIWGAAIAGANAALALTRAGRSVLVFPRGPGSYLETPGFAVLGERIATRKAVEEDLLLQAEHLGAVIARGIRMRSVLPDTGPVRAVITKQANVSLRAMVFADGSDPRVVRSRELVPDWEPWHLVHFASQLFPLPPGASSVRVIAGEREGRPWRGYSVPLADAQMISVAWFLEHEMAINVHASELLPDVIAQFGFTGEPFTEPVVEISPWGGQRMQALLAAENTLVIGDMSGLLNPFALNRSELAMRMGEAAAQAIDRQLAHGDDVHFGSETAKYLRSSVQEQGIGRHEPEYPVFPFPAHVGRRRLPGLLRRFRSRSDS
jgi:flavin-dependent dehydrogenase